MRQTQFFEFTLKLEVLQFILTVLQIGFFYFFEHDITETGNNIIFFFDTVYLFVLNILPTMLMLKIWQKF